MPGNIIGPAADKSFSELLADEAKEQGPQLVTATIKAFKDGEPAAIKLVTTALLESQYTEQEKFPITDARFKEIICIAADRIRGVL